MDSCQSAWSHNPMWPLHLTDSLAEIWGMEAKIRSSRSNHPNPECEAFCRTNDPVSSISKWHKKWREGGLLVLKDLRVLITKRKARGLFASSSNQPSLTTRFLRQPGKWKLIFANPRVEKWSLIFELNFFPDSQWSFPVFLGHVTYSSVNCLFMCSDHFSCKVNFLVNV